MLTLHCETECQTTHPPSALLLRKDRPPNPTICYESGAAALERRCPGHRCAGELQVGNPAYLGSAWGPREAVHPHTALLYTSFLGLSEDKEKQTVSDREVRSGDFPATASVSTIPSLLAFSLKFYWKVDKIILRKNTFSQSN